jgi:hypothetical protein
VLTVFRVAHFEGWERKIGLDGCSVSPLISLAGLRPQGSRIGLLTVLVVFCIAVRET